MLVSLPCAKVAWRRVARKAEVEVEINIEKICHGVKGLNSEIRKCRNWSEAESHDIEIAMGKTGDIVDL